MSLILALLMGAQAVPAAVIADPPRDTAHPARNEQMLIPSDGAGMNALMMHASGAGTKPVVVLLHGLPGNERNLDLAQAIRRAGWSVLTFSYRGAFGSPGQFSIGHAVEDADAAAAFLRAPGNAARLNVDPGRIVFAGHSMGGFAAALHAAHDPALAGLVLIDTANLGARGATARANHVEAATMAKGFDDLGNILQGADPVSLANEVLGAPAGWDLDRAAPALKALPVLVIGARFGLGKENEVLATALRGGGNARVKGMTLASDHSFSDHRIALAGAVVGWLQTLPR